MITWHLIFQEDQLPISVGRADGVHRTPPPGLVRYIELAHGAWALEPATKPLGMEGVEWPKPCVGTDVTSCAGAMSYGMPPNMALQLTSGGSVVARPRETSCECVARS